MIINIPTCAIHNKEMKQGKYGLFCPTPISRNPDGSVAEWCKYKPGEVPVEEPTKTRSIPEKQLEEPDWNKIAEGKVRNSIAVAFIGKMTEPSTLNPNVVTLMNQWVTWIMTGDYEEVVSEAELDQVFSESEVENATTELKIARIAKERAEIEKANKA